MEEYWEQNKPTVTSAMEHQSVVMDAWQPIVADYDREIGDGKDTFGTNPTQHSVEKEYSTYVMGALSAVLYTKPHSPSRLRGLSELSEYCPRSPSKVQIVRGQSEDSPRTVRVLSEQSLQSNIFYFARTLLGLCSDFGSTLLGFC